MSIQHTHHFILYNCYEPRRSDDGGNLNYHSRQYDFGNKTLEDILGPLTVDRGHQGGKCSQTRETCYCDEYLAVWAKGLYY